jgi:Ni,Fe-hydrogenase I small subunit
MAASDAPKRISGTTGPFYERLSGIIVPGIESTPDTIGKTLLGLSVIGVGAHAISTVARKGIRNITNPEADPNAGEKR